MRLFGVCGILAAAVMLAGCQSPASFAPQARTGQVAQPAKRTATQPAEVLVKFKATMRAQELSAFRTTFGTRNVGYIAGIDVYVEEVAASRQPIEQVVAAMNASPLVEYAELNGEVRIVR